MCDAINELIATFGGYFLKSLLEMDQGDGQQVLESGPADLA